MKHDDGHEKTQNDALEAALDALIAHFESGATDTLEKLKAARAKLDADDKA